MNKKQENKLRYDFVSIGGFISAIVILLFAGEYIPQNASSSILSLGEAAGVDSVDYVDYPTDLNTLTLESLRTLSMLEVAEMDITLMRSRRQTTVRKFLPDGWVETYLRTTATVRAGIDLSGLTAEDISITTDSDGNRHATIRLPNPQITHKELNDENWGHASNLWLWAPDRIALELRQDIRVAIYAELDHLAVEAGLLEEAKAITVGMILTPIESSCCLKSVCVNFQDGRAIEIGTRALTSAEEENAE